MQFEKAVKVLCDSGADFIVIGGLAAALHGSATVTYDLEICYSRTSDNLSRLAAALAPFHPKPRDFPAGLLFIWSEGTLRNATVSTLYTDQGEIDLLAEVQGLGGFNEVQNHSVMAAAFGREFATLDLPALIRAKRATGRPKDLAALPELESLLEANEPE